MSEKPPKKIYLQMLDEDGEEQDEITWCEDEINDTDIAYVLQSALTTAQEENKRYKLALEKYELAIKEAEAILGGEYAMQYGPFFDLVQDAQSALNGGKNEG